MTVGRVAGGRTVRTYRWDGDGLPRAVALSGGGREVAVVDRGPVVEVDGARVEGSDLEPAGPVGATAGGGLAWTARHPATGLELRWTVEGDDAAGVVRTRLALAGRGRTAAVTVEDWGGVAARGPAPGGGGHLGQPVLGDGWFGGLEHPGAQNTAGAGGHVTFSLPLAAELGPSPVELPPVVVGAAEPGHELAAFWDHLDRVRARPPSLVVLANNWYQLGAVGRMDEASVTAELAGFAGVADRHAIPLRHYCLDDPWDGSWEEGTGLWGRLDPGRFPGGPDALARTAGGAHRLGLWVSPWGGYFDRHDHRTAWGRAHGYEVEDGNWPRLCPAGDRYRAHLLDAMRRWAAAGIGYWKIDGVQFDCADPTHGHAVGDPGRTDQMDRFARLLDEVRAANPGAVLVFTTGSNPSPWWLRHADFLWRGGLDDDAPAAYDGSSTERFDTYIDACLDALRDSALPVSAIVTFSLVENQARAYREPGQDPAAWARHCWLLAGRGTLHHDLYVAPDSLGPREWDELSAALRWAAHHQRPLARAHMVGGRPQANEAYGFVGVGGGEVAGCLRNPAARPATVVLDAVDLGAPAELTVDWGGARLPARAEAGGRWEVELGPFEVVVFSGRSSAGTGRGPRG